MPRKQKLKVFRTPIGFHDAYVAAPSQTAALQAWGSEHDLFARGVAEKVDDPELMREPLKQPGIVIRRLRGTANEQIAALPEGAPKKKRSSSQKPLKAPARDRPSQSDNRAAPRKPKPDRAGLDEAERTLAEAGERHAREREALARRQAQLERERDALERSQAREIAKLQQTAEKLRSRYERAVREWQG